MNERHHYKAAVAVDLGAKATGLFTAVHPADRTPTRSDAAVATVLFPDQINFTLSQQDRTKQRHARRNRKRFQLARELFFLCIDEAIKNYGLSLSVKDNRQLQEGLCSLIKRRGYTYIEGKSAEDVDLYEIDSRWLAAVPPMDQFFHEGFSVGEEWETLSQNPRRVKLLRDQLPKPLEFGKAFVKAFPEEKSSAMLCRKVVKKLHELASDIVNQLLTGKRHRTDYLQIIREDIRRDKRLKPAVTVCGGEDEFWCLLGNLCNMELRGLRWYFMTFKNGLRDFDADRLKDALRRQYQYFEAGNAEEQGRINDLLRRLNNNSLWTFLTTTDPVLTIPPYNRMYNRGTPNDLTLLLSPEALNRRWGGDWHIWVRRLESRCPEMADGLLNLENRTDRRSRRKQNHLPPQDYTKARFLQRILDRTMRDDPFSLRLLAKDAPGRKANAGLEELTRAIGSQHVDGFVEMASAYFMEVTAAKSGLWLLNPDSLLERADIHPPMKSKVIDLLIANLFGFDEQDAAVFRQSVWTEPFYRTSTVCSLAKRLCKMRETNGASFHVDLANARRLVENGVTKVPADLKPYADALYAIERVKEHWLRIGMDKACVTRAGNIYTIMSLHDLIEKDRSGFTKTTVATHLENAWRCNGENGARCCRLPADCVRPFDGMLARLLGRQAYELAKVVFSELSAKVKEKNADIDLSVLIEENRFAFSADLNEIKMKKDKRTKAEKQDEEQQRRWMKKRDRIAFAGRGICPVMGSDLAEGEGVNVHIIPRSYTMTWMGTIFNHEANLIRMSEVGQQKVKGSRLTLDMLSPQYLNAIFGTSDLVEIEDFIENRIQFMAKTHRLNIFEALSDEEQACVRHALFLGDASEARIAVIRTFGNLSKTAVNGTQPWFVRTFITKLLALSESWRKVTGNTFCFNAWKVSPQDVWDTRQALSEDDPAWKKGEGGESLASHAIDAMCAYAVAAGNPMVCTKIGAAPDVSDMDSYATARPLQNLYPDRLNVIRITRKPMTEKTDKGSRALFKAGIYGEHFLPVIVFGKTIYVGFDIPGKGKTTGNCLLVTGESTHLVRDLAPFFKEELPENFFKPVAFHVNADKAFALFSRIFRKDPLITEDDIRVAEVLDSLYYTTKRKEVKGLVLNQYGNAYRSREEAEPNCSLKVAYTSRSADYRFSGKLMLPSYPVWQSYLDSPELSDKWGRAVKDVTTFDIDEFLQKKAGIKGGKSKHSPYKAVVSLPVVATPSPGIRMDRRTIGGTVIHQLLEVERSGPYVGIAMNEDGSIDWKQPLLRPELIGKRGTPLNFRQSLFREGQKVLKFTETRSLYKDEQLSVSMSPATDSRRRVRITTDFKTFRNWLAVEGVKNVPETPLDLCADYAAGKWSHIEEFFPKQASLLNRPKDKIAVESCGERVTFSYISRSVTQAMNEAYSAA